jgi:hypothetical protein
MCIILLICKFYGLFSPPKTTYTHISHWFIILPRRGLISIKTINKGQPFPGEDALNTKRECPTGNKTWAYVQYSIDM